MSASSVITSGVWTPAEEIPKQTGYGWICQDCDTSSSKEEEEVQPQEDDAVKQETAVQESLN